MVITVSKDTSLNPLILVDSIQNAVIIENDITATVVELNYTGANTQTNILVKKNARLNYILIQAKNNSAQNFTLQQDLQAASIVNSYIFNYQENQSKLNYTCNLNEELAENNLYCLQNTSNSQIDTLNININHNLPNCLSNTQIRSIARDQSRAAVTGKIFVAEHAVGTNANLQSKGLLLSATAEIITQPQLEIYNNEVQCTHGATIGSLDDEEIFYLNSRGLTDLQAKELLLAAFIAPTLPSNIELPAEIRALIK